ncbi:GMC oxidoreductase [Luteimonas saliphila]|uniref:GMC oxidoreductase n=1 Tax=Luteimonas saliphila TaxID=2804919 RepID=UPI001EE3132A|nr:GMC family oxidoreductase [Luteimonas saliphila]
MIKDFRAPDCPDRFEADLCIVGAGPAGLTIAAEFANTRWKVCLLESGGLHSEHASQALSDGESVGPCMLDPGISRLRALGGAARLWGGGCIPLSSLEMAAREWVPDSGWPIGWNELAPYYARASRACRVEPGGIEDGSFVPPRGAARRAPPSVNLSDRTFRISPVDYASTHLDLLRAAPNLELVLHANLMRLDVAEDAAAVLGAAIGGLDGRRGRVSARLFVLAAGGLENARLLLLSDQVARNGLGNDRDLVGRYFMDHPRCGLGTLHGGGLDRLARGYAWPLDHAPARAHRQLSLSDHAQRTHRLLAARAWPFLVERPAPPGVRALRSLRASLRRPANPADESRCVERQLLDALDQDLPARLPPPAPDPGRVRLALSTLRHGGHLVHAGCRKLVRSPTVATDRIEMVGYFEQAPNRDSRVALSDQRDALGLRKVKVDWRLGTLDERSIRTAATLMASDVAAHFKCDFEPADWLHDTSATPRVQATAHHMGTTRMASSPGKGVVDLQCRVHGIDNLYVAGSSVFPTGGWSFPTLTVVALATRLADELHARIAAVTTLATSWPTGML